MSDYFVTSRTVAHQASLSMGFPRQEYWNGLPFPSSGDLPDSGIKLRFPNWQVDSLPLSQQESCNGLLNKLRYIGLLSINGGIKELH